VLCAALLHVHYTPPGKSSLLNAICGEERSIVCDLSGTTRDAVDTTITLPDGQKLLLIDTAGIRKRARVADSKCVAQR
jgi:GTP-binding protein